MSCDFCDERKGIRTIYNEIYGEKNRIVYETEHFSVFPCMGQLREGHLLIASKEHINAMGMLDRTAIKELEELISAMGIFFREKYQKNVLCFEHGVLSDNGENGGCGIYHMHLHVLPIEKSEFFKILDEVKGKEGNFVCSVGGIEEASACVADQNTYIFLSQMDETRKQEAYMVNNRNNYFRSQYMRKVVGKVIGKTDWDWKSIKVKELDFLKTMEKSKAFFADYEQ